MTAEQFIKDYTRTDSNEFIAIEDIHGKKVISYHEWLTPEQALRAVELGRNNLWKPADGDDLPKIDREVVALRGLKDPTATDCLCGYEIVFAHRPNPDEWDGRSILTGEVDHYTPKTYDKGGWNIPDVKWWLDLDLPKMEE